MQSKKMISRFWILIFILIILFGFLSGIKSGGIGIKNYTILSVELVALIIPVAFLLKKEKPLQIIIYLIGIFCIGKSIQSVLVGGKSINILKEVIITGIVIVCEVFVVIICSKGETFFLRIDKKKLFLVCLILYIILMLFGRNSSGTKAWLSLGGLSLQLTEVIKVVSILFYTMCFCDGEIGEWKKIYDSFLFLIFNIFGMMLLSEMGTALILILVWLIYLILFIRDYKKICVCILLMTLFLCMGYFILTIFSKQDVLVGFRDLAIKILSRILGYKQPLEDIYGADYQMYNAMKALSLGGWFGNAKYHINIPASDTDFIFPVLINQYGFIIGILVIVFFSGIMGESVRLYIRQIRHNHLYYSGIIAGAAYMLVIQALLMIFGSCKFFILTGIPLPFLSNGGTAQIVNLTLVTVIILFGNMD